MAKVRSWEVSDEFWNRVAPFIPKREREAGKVFHRKSGGGRKPMSERRVFEAIVFVLRTGCQWKSLPKERFGSASSIHKYFRQWLKAGFFLALGPSRAGWPDERNVRAGPGGPASLSTMRWQGLPGSGKAWMEP